MNRINLPSTLATYNQDIYPTLELPADAEPLRGEGLRIQIQPYAIDGILVLSCRNEYEGVDFLFDAHDAASLRFLRIARALKCLVVWHAGAGKGLVAKAAHDVWGRAEQFLANATEDMSSAHSVDFGTRAAALVQQRVAASKSGRLRWPQSMVIAHGSPGELAASLLSSVDEMEACTNTAAEMPATMRAIHVHAQIDRSWAVDEIYCEDWDATGLYEVLVPAEFDDGKAACCALDAFNMAIPIKRLWMFTLTALDPESGIQLERDEDYEWYELTEHADGVHLLGHLG